MEEKNISKPIVENADSSKEKEAFFRADVEGQSITDQDRISYYKTVLNDEILENDLLGIFDSKGKYKLSEDIINELIIIPKFVHSETQDELGRLLYLISYVGIEGYSDIKFQLRIKEIKESDTEINYEATISLLESIKKVEGFVENTLITPFATFKAKKSEAFMPSLYAKFNIKSEAHGDSKKVDPKLMKFILDKIRECRYKNSFYNLELEALYGKFLLKRIKLLKASGKYGEYVLRQFSIKKAQAENFLLINKNKLNKNLLQLLDMCEDLAKGKGEDLLHKKYGELLNNFSKSYAEINKMKNNEYQKLKNPEKEIKLKDPKQAKSKSASSKKEASKSSASGGKKADKKQDFLVSPTGGSGKFDISNESMATKENEIKYVSIGKSEIGESLEKAVEADKKIRNEKTKNTISLDKGRNK